MEIILINGYRAERSWLQGGVGSRKGRGPTEWGGPPAATDRKHEKTIYTMKADNIYKTSLLAAALLLAATSCVKDTLYNTPHPDTGRITVTADWTDRGDGVDIPAEWTVVMGGYTGTETGETHAPDYLFAPGNYTLVAYNTPVNITIDGTVARVSVPSGVSTGGSASAMDEDTDSGAGGFISGTPGWLFTSVQEMTIEADTDHDLTAAMHQQVRQLTLVIEPTGDAADRIESIEGSLSGAAGTLDFAAWTYGTASDVALQVTSGIQTHAYDDQWEKGDEIGIFGFTQGDAPAQAYTNERYVTTGGDGVFTPDGTTIYVPTDGSSLDFVAYYPHTTDLENGIYTVDVEDQSDLSTIDLMAAGRQTANRIKNTVTFNFEHKLSKIVLNFADGDGITLSELAGMKVQLTNQRTKATFDVTKPDGEVVVGTDSPIDITLFTDADGMSSEGIVLPSANFDNMTLHLELADGSTCVIEDSGARLSAIEPCRLSVPNRDIDFGDGVREEAFASFEALFKHNISAFISQIPIDS